MSPDRRRLAAAAGAVIVVATAVAVIVTFGVVPLPEFPALAENPDASIPGTVAFTRQERDGMCVFLVAASGGEPRRLLCEEGIDGSLEWKDGLVAAQRWGWPGGGERVFIDPGTGRIVRRETLDEHAPPSSPGQEAGHWVRVDGARIVTTHEGGRARLDVVAPDGRATQLLSVEGPRDYAFYDALWSPDGRYVLLSDSRERLIVVDPDGGSARLLATEAYGPAWGPAATADTRP